MFEGQFTQAPLTASQYIEEPQFKEKTLALPGAQPLDTLQTVLKLVVKEKPDNFNDYVAWARLTWQKLFYNQPSFFTIFHQTRYVVKWRKRWSGTYCNPIFFCRLLLLEAHFGLVLRTWTR